MVKGPFWQTANVGIRIFPLLCNLYPVQWIHTHMHKLTSHPQYEMSLYYDQSSLLHSLNPWQGTEKLNIRMWWLRKSGNFLLVKCDNSPVDEDDISLACSFWKQKVLCKFNQWMSLNSPPHLDCTLYVTGFFLKFCFPWSVKSHVT